MVTVLVLVLMVTVVVGDTVVVDSVVVMGAVEVCVTVGANVIVGGGAMTADVRVVVVVVVVVVLDGPDASFTMAQISSINRIATSTPAMNSAAGLRYQGTGGSGGGP
ncbi:hypothetical protein [Mycobacterium sp.]|jgi:hypothetical protein|uniref:hypothetical protein n=1 Tax=Mycobacterium sp. TaxID=1785 RepID=UPI002D597519|nr:hypothetical protein [Mycobacterium sp.]HZA09010.1 hypothetical protein [Mycobacterium sp.]